MQSAFPIPRTGMFSDLLAAIDDAEENCRAPAHDPSR
jgi:hypothetical protein